MLLEKARRHADEIRRAGAEAIKETLAAGVPVYHIDDRIGAGIIKECPTASVSGSKLPRAWRS